MDGWISSSEGTLPEQLYSTALQHFTASMVLCLQGNKRSTIVRGYSAPVEQSTIIDEFACRWHASKHHESQKTARPISVRKLVEIERQHIAFDALLLPQKGGGWSLAAVDFQLVLPIPIADTHVDEIDTVLQLHYQGFSAKEIAQRVELSHRTVEHRIERMKARIGARTISQLVALSVASGLRGKTPEA
ncbi:LuxR C-terminal-related transcriptional regulator [Rhizobium johnstonii]|uniref:LuxR C-terminal-related transcriptional regulator n=1 Tax=Rhizobium johnstonii TaxID=3019933 RepID=UPI003F9D5F72